MQVKGRHFEAVRADLSLSDTVTQSIAAIVSSAYMRSGPAMRR